MSPVPQQIRTALSDELTAARHAFDVGNADEGWRRLERAHVLSQPWASPHVRVHFVMLRRGWHVRDRIEVSGQVIRLLVAGPGSLLRRYPVGNTGRARVPATKPMPLENDLAALLTVAGKHAGQ